MRIKPKFRLCGERWGLIPGLTGYAASTFGRVASCRKKHPRIRGVLGSWKLMKPSVNRQGYLYVCLTDNSGKLRRCKVHQLVLMTFIGPRLPGYVSRHFPDPDPANNNLCNLSYSSHKRNMQDKREHGTSREGVLTWTAKLTDDKVVLARRLFKPWSRKYGVAALARRFNVNESTMRSVIQKKSWRHV